MSLNRQTLKRVAPFLTPIARSWYRLLVSARSSAWYVARRAPFLEPDRFDRVYIDNRGNHPTEHIRTTRRVTDVRGARVLVLGCRSGEETLMWLRNGARSVTALDYSPRPATWQSLSARDNRIRFLAGDARNLPFADDSFDVVSSESLLEHVRYPQQAIAEMHRVVKRSGLVYAIFGPLFTTAGGAHFEGDFEHLLMERRAFIEFIQRRNRPIEREECLHYFAADMFSYWTADQYLAEFRKHDVLWSAVFLSPDAARFRHRCVDEWRRLTERYAERDLLISGLALWSRKRAQ